MMNYIKIAQGVNVNSLALELHQHPELWNVDIERLRPTAPHRDSDDIWIRYNDKTQYLKSDDWTHFNDSHESVWYPAFYALPSLRKLIFDLMAAVQGERLGGVLIWRLQPGHAIHPHRDAGWHVDYYDKFNICVQGNPDGKFVYTDHDEAIVAAAGDVHRFINTENHTVVNNGSEDMIVLCVCIKVHDYDERYQR